MDYKLAIYMYIKHLWDGWFSGIYNSNDLCCINNDKNKTFEYKDIFNVKNYFENFIFVDSFYRNTFQRLRLNCNKLLEYYNGVNDSKNLFNVLGDIANSVNSMFLSLPDFVCIGDGNDVDAYKSMESLFKPMPANQVPLPSLTNKFVCMYTHRPSEIATNDKGYKVDGFDIWSENSDSCAPPILKNSCEGYGDDDQDSPDYKLGKMNRYGYNVPSFGVAYSRQQNSIFKNIKISMNNPAMTEAAIQSYAAIVEQGNTSAKKVCFYGQDLYNVYSNYSYIVEVEMMGNAQIQPLMYFQLMNIPMFRGTYMIISVTHNISQGNMVTSFKGVKMSKYCVPYTSNWFSLMPQEIESESTTSEMCVSDSDEASTNYVSVQTTEQKDANGLAIMRYLIEKGFKNNKGELIKLNKYQACAIAGNYYGESEWNTTVYEKGSGAGYGLVQWTSPTRRNILSGGGAFNDFRNMKGFPETSIEQWSNGDLQKQLEYSTYEFSREYYDNLGLWGDDLSKPNGNMMAYKGHLFKDNISDPDKEFEDNKTEICDMVRRFCRVYEVPDESKANYPKRNGGAKKALKLYDEYLCKLNKVKEGQSTEGDWTIENIRKLTQDDLMKMLCVLTDKKRYKVDNDGGSKWFSVNGTDEDKKITFDKNTQLCIQEYICKGDDKSNGIHSLIYTFVTVDDETKKQSYKLYAFVPNDSNGKYYQAPIEYLKKLYIDSKKLEIPNGLTLKKLFELMYFSWKQHPSLSMCSNKKGNEPCNLYRYEETTKDGKLFRKYRKSGITYQKMVIKCSKNGTAEYWSLCEKSL